MVLCEKIKYSPSFCCQLYSSTSRKLVHTQSTMYILYTYILTLLMSESDFLDSLYADACISQHPKFMQREQPTNLSPWDHGRGGRVSGFPLQIPRFITGWIAA
jgi:hypothetical protein